jgi:hypothetical protein
MTLRLKSSGYVLQGKLFNTNQGTHTNQEDFPKMVRSASLFSQLLQHFPRTEFDRLVRQHGAEHGAKGFKCWTQFVAMVFCHLAHADSLREICNGLACCLGKISHLGLLQAPKRSTLSYANAHRPAALFEDLFWRTAERFRANGGLARRKKRFNFKNKLLSLDSTTISLCLNLFPWASYRRQKGGVKVHVLLNHDDYLPEFVRIDSARGHDRLAARFLRLPPGSIVAFDRAYNDYGLFGQWTASQIYFVTRMKENTRYRVERSLPLPQGRNILSDEIVRLTGVAAQEKCPHDLRRIVVWDAENDREIVLLTNHLGFGATTIAAIYKDRWEIELFFKALKQNLKIKSFVGTTENALRIQIWTALIALLLLRWLTYLSHASWSFSNLASMLRLNLFTYRDLHDWIAQPFGPPPPIPDESEGIQLEMHFPGLGQPMKA